MTKKSPLEMGHIVLAFQANDRNAPKGARHNSPGQRPEGRNNFELRGGSIVSPFQGIVLFIECSQGVALGYLVMAFQADDESGATHDSANRKSLLWLGWPE